MLTLTASIGYSVLLNAIRLKSNHIEYRMVDTFDPISTGCDHCMVDRNLCDACLLKKYRTETKKVYINESARHGRKNSLSRYGIMTLLWLHFNAPDENGLIRRLDIQDLCDAIGCTYRTALNQLHDLSTYGYIGVSKLSIPGYYSIIISDYTSYFKPAVEGGRGYMTISYDMFEKFKEQKDINSLRVTIRGVYTATEQKRLNGFVEEKSIKEIKRELPSYVTNGQIREILKSQSFVSMFDVYNKKKYTISFKLKDAYMQFGMRDKLVKDCRTAIEQCAKELSHSTPIKNKFKLSEYDLKCISEIGARFPIKNVVDALRTVFNTYFVNGIRIKDIGALVRTITKSYALVDSYLLDSIA